MALPGRTRRSEYTAPGAAGQGSVNVVPVQEPGVKDEPEGTDQQWVQKARPQRKFIKFEDKGDAVEGVLKSFFESEFEGKKSVNAVLVVDGEDKSLRLSMQLEQYFEGVEFGTTVRIVYKGKIGKMKAFDFFTSQQ